MKLDIKYMVHSTKYFPLVFRGSKTQGDYYRTICTLIKGKVKGEQIGVTGDYPIIVTSIGCLFLFRVDGPGETSPVTWGFEKARSRYLLKGPLSQVTTDQKVQEF